MKAIGLTELGCVIQGNKKPYKFTVIDNDCGKPIPYAKVQSVVTKGNISIVPEKITTDEFGIGECIIDVLPQVKSQDCVFQIICIAD